MLSKAIWKYQTGNHQGLKHTQPRETPRKGRYSRRWPQDWTVSKSSARDKTSPKNSKNPAFIINICWIKALLDRSVCWNRQTFQSLRSLIRTTLQSLIWSKIKTPRRCPPARLTKLTFLFKSPWAHMHYHLIILWHKNDLSSILQMALFCKGKVFKNQVSCLIKKQDHFQWTGPENLRWWRQNMKCQIMFRYHLTLNPILKHQKSRI